MNPTQRNMARIDGWYSIEGVRLPSVTSILQVLSKPALIPWAAKLGAAIQKAEKPVDDKALMNLFYERQQKTMTRGSNIHNIIENYFKTGSLILPMDPDGHYKAFTKFLEEWELDPIHVEEIVFSFNDEYAGRCDFIGRMRSKKKGSKWQMVVGDWKTSKTPRLYPEVQLQLSAYAFAARELGLIKDFDTIAGICFAATGNYKLQQFVYNYEAFKNVKKVWEWTRQSS